MIVVDTNVLAHLFLPGERSGQAEAALRRDADWAAPRLWRSELRNVLSTGIRREHLLLEEAIVVMDRARGLLHGREFDVSSASVLELAAESGCSAYDCEFVALARELRVPLVTTDRQIVDRFAGLAVDLEAFVDDGRTTPDTPER